MSLWTLTSCKEDAAQYSRRSDWAKNSSAAYNTARVNSWLDECCVHMVAKKRASVS